MGAPTHRQLQTGSSQCKGQPKGRARHQRQGLILKIGSCQGCPGSRWVICLAGVRRRLAMQGVAPAHVASFRATDLQRDAPALHRMAHAATCKFTPCGVIQRNVLAANVLKRGCEPVPAVGCPVFARTGGEQQFTTDGVQCTAWPTLRKREGESTDGLVPSHFANTLCAKVACHPVQPSQSRRTPRDTHTDAQTRTCARFCIKQWVPGGHRLPGAQWPCMG